MDQTKDEKPIEFVKDSNKEVVDTLARLITTLFQKVPEIIQSEKEASKPSAIARRKADFKGLVECLCEPTKTFSNTNFLEKLADYLNKNKRILYSEFTAFIVEKNEDEDNGESAGIIITNLENLFEFVVDNDAYEGRIQEAIIKLWDHANLAVTQYSLFNETDDVFLNKINPVITPQIDALKAEYEMLSKEVNRAKKEAEIAVAKTVKMKNSIITDTIALISIFVAISFVMFGGMTMLNSLFDFSGMSSIPVTEMLCIGSLIGIVVISICYAFINFVLYITEKIPVEREVRWRDLFCNNSVFVKIYIVSILVLTLIMSGTFFCWMHNIDPGAKKQVHTEQEITENEASEVQANEQDEGHNLQENQKNKKQK